LAGVWIETNSTIDDDGSLAEHSDKVGMKRVRFTKYLVGRAERLVPPEQSSMHWRYVIRRNESVAYGLYFRTDVVQPLMCGTVLLRRQDDNSWAGIFSRPTERADDEAVSPVILRAGWMTSPLRWVHSPTR
jgi:hypothetical protein